MWPRTPGPRTQRVLYGAEARAALIRGIDQMVGLVAPTLGPLARTVAIDKLVSTTPGGSLRQRRDYRAPHDPVRPAV